uniref:Uncharacterized protein n=1 Tax=Arundo donax TaxID=35708 RepID=A0A0A9HC21_ARUDO
MMRISAVMMPRTISLTFIFCNHILCRIRVPCCLKSTAW